jgi:hypothetical protein
VKLLGYDDHDRPYLVWQVAALAAVIALLAGLGLGSLLTGRSEATGTDVGTSAPLAGTTDAPGLADCPELIPQTDAALHQARALRDALATQTQVANDVVAGRAEAEPALRAALPSLTTASRRSVQFDVEVQRYETVRDRCRGQ